MKIKIAILLLIHQFSEQQNQLVSHLAKDFEVYIHIDNRTKIKKNDISIKNVNVYKKINVYWGSYNQIAAILYLLISAYEDGFDRYILISGEDIPIKSNQEIKKYFENNNKEYFDCHELPTRFWSDNGGYDRIDFFHTNSLSKGPTKKMQRIITRVCDKINNRMVIPYMKRNNIKRRLGIKYFGGASWFDITNQGAQYILDFLEKNKKYLRKFKFTLCADEIFFHTIIANSHSLSLENKCNRYIDWTTGPEYPRVLRSSDYKRIVNSDAIFARKVSQEIDAELIKKIYSDIK